MLTPWCCLIKLVILLLKDWVIYLQGIEHSEEYIIQKHFLIFLLFFEPISAFDPDPLPTLAVTSDVSFLTPLYYPSFLDIETTFTFSYSLASTPYVGVTNFSLISFFGFNLLACCPSYPSPSFLALVFWADVLWDIEMLLI